MNEEIQQLEAEITQKKAKLEKLKVDAAKRGRAAVVRSLSSYTVEEKCKHFDKLYGYAQEALEHVETEGYSDDDTPHYTWEAVMELLTHPNNSRAFWDYYNRRS